MRSQCAEHSGEVQHNEVLSVCFPGALSVASVPPSRVQCGGFDPQQTRRQPFGNSGFPPNSARRLAAFAAWGYWPSWDSVLPPQRGQPALEGSGSLVNSVSELERATIEVLQRYIHENSPSDKVRPLLASFGRMVQLLQK
jgi:hypothetical protein